jgi:hypothetical protein
VRFPRIESAENKKIAAFTFLMDFFAPQKKKGFLALKMMERLNKVTNYFGPRKFLPKAN